MNIENFLNPVQSKRENSNILEFLPPKIINFDTEIQSDFFSKCFHQVEFLNKKCSFDTLCIRQTRIQRAKKEWHPLTGNWFQFKQKKVQNFHTFNLELLFVTLKNKNYSTAVLFLCKLFLISSMTLFALLLSLGLPSRKKWLKNFLSAAALRGFFFSKKFYSQWMKTLKKALLTELEIDDPFFFFVVIWII